MVSVQKVAHGAFCRPRSPPTWLAMLTGGPGTGRGGLGGAVQRCGHLAPPFAVANGASHVFLFVSPSGENGGKSPSLNSVDSPVKAIEKLE